jgi:hypothetical protein
MGEEIPRSKEVVDMNSFLSDLLSGGLPLHLMIEASKVIP